jgi:hypothetical protein
MTRPVSWGYLEQVWSDYRDSNCVCQLLIAARHLDLVWDALPGDMCVSGLLLVNQDRALVTYVAYGTWRNASLETQGTCMRLPCWVGLIVTQLWDCVKVTACQASPLWLRWMCERSPGACAECFEHFV